MKYFFVLGWLCVLNFYSNTSYSQVSEKLINKLVNDTALSNAHVGICIYEPETSKYWVAYNSNKYFIPASSTKLFSLYAGLHYLGDSLVGIQYFKKNDSLYLKPTGDATFLHKDFNYQPILRLIKNNSGPVFIINNKLGSNKLGYGWAWDDFDEDYMAQRSAFPIYGNTTTIEIERKGRAMSASFSPEIPYASINESAEQKDKSYITRDFENNNFKYYLTTDLTNFSKVIPIETQGIQTAVAMLHGLYPLVYGTPISEPTFKHQYLELMSTPTDSFFHIMMNRSDNFFAEQTLLMSSNKVLKRMSTEKMIEHLLANDLKGIPQPPQWVDGSGLSRYNLFTPESFIFLLNKMKKEFGLVRLKNILPTGGEGTLKNYYLHSTGKIFAKTGTLSNNCSLNGYLITQKGKLLLFSVIANNYNGKATPVRRAVEQFLEKIQSEN